MEATFRAGSTVLGKYRIENVLGRDGMYIALRVSHPQLGADLVLKMLVPESATSLTVHARFVREAQSAARLRGEHVARIIDAGISSDGVPYLVTEALRGVDLAAELVRRGALIPGEAVDYLLQACDALAEAHACSIVHRHIAPANILLAVRADGVPLVKVLDFGTSQVTISGNGGPPTKPDAISGVAGYAAPEQRRGEELDGRCDQWAIGAVLYECLTGRRAFAADASPLGRAAQIAPPPAMDSQIPAQLAAVVMRCLAPDRNARFPSIAALVAALAPYAHDPHAAGFFVERATMLSHGVDPLEGAAPGAYSIVGAPHVSGPTAVPAGRSRRRYATIAVVAIGASIGGISTAALIRPGRSRPAGDPPAVALPSRDAIAARAPATPTPVAALPAPPPIAKPVPVAVPVPVPVAPPVAAPAAPPPVAAPAPPPPVAAPAPPPPTTATRAPVARAEDKRAKADPKADDRSDDKADDADDDRPTRTARTEDRPARRKDKESNCDSVDVSDLMTRAATEYDSGAAGSALSLARVALNCKQTDRMYWLAVLYACAAHDLSSARQYFAKVPANLQAGVERKCQADNLDVRTR